MGWIRGGKIGLGSYGCVYKALDKQTGHIFAVKKGAFEDADPDDRKHLERLQDEINICKGLRHPHIVSYLGHEYSQGNLYILLEYVAGGSIAAVLNEFGPLEYHLLKTGTKGVLEGLDYLHTRSPPVVHRDIKGANLLVDQNFCVKLADFGCSKRDAQTRSFTTIGSIPWMAPEVMVQKDGHGRKADIWSVGCTIIEMATADKPWGKNKFDNVMAAIKHIGMSGNTPPISDDVPADARDLISRCLKCSPDERPWSVELLAHDFIQSTTSDSC